MESTELYIRICNLVKSMPDITSAEILEMRPETLKWFGDAHALTMASGDIVSATELKIEIDKLVANVGMGGISVDRVTSAARAIPTILFRVLSAAELKAPASYQGGFIHAGNPFDAMAAISKVFGTVTNDILIIDGFLDEKVLTEFAPLLAEGVNIRLLTGQAKHKSSFPVAVTKWKSQYAAKRPLEAKLAEDRLLHDRLIFVDNREVWDFTQSLNAFATRSPATISRFNDENNSKKDWYESVWQTASILS